MQPEALFSWKKMYAITWLVKKRKNSNFSLNVYDDNSGVGVGRMTTLESSHRGTVDNHYFHNRSPAHELKSTTLAGKLLSSLPTEKKSHLK